MNFRINHEPHTHSYFTLKMLSNFKWNWSEFCGSDDFQIWVSNHQDLSPCFQLLCLQIPIFSIIAIVSAYYAGKHTEFFIRTIREKRILKFRMCVVLLLACRPAAQIVILVYNNSKSLHVIDYGFAILASFSWFVHFSYVSALRSGMSMSLRGPIKLISLWIMLFIACVIQARSMYLKFQNDTSFEATVSLTFALIATALQILYGFSLLFGEDSTSRRSTLNAFDQENMTSSRGYIRFREDFDPQYLGVAMEDSGFLSKLSFTWVNSLMEKGAKNQLDRPRDVFELPEELSDILLASTYSSLDPPPSLLRLLHREFAVEFYSIGILKLISDLASLAAPLLLNELLLFIDDPKMPMSRGYMFAGGIFLASVIGSFCIVHFDFYIGKISLKFQAYLITLIYSEILRMDSVLLKTVGVGTIINHVSIDMERIANSCSSVHGLWSMPFQLGVTLYLLYTQVGVASLCGVFCSIFLIPVNRIVAKKIGEFSTRMMEEKDKRVGLMSEFIRGIRQIKLYVWEDYFVSRILGVRAEEVRYLKYRKYLDALCVYFWATTPVMISTLTFTVFIYLGGTLNAAVVFTSLSLLNMLRMPLNAFPWLLNGVVEAWVSIKRVDTFLQSVSRLDTKRRSDKEQVKTNGDVAVVVKRGCTLNVSRTSDSPRSESSSVSTLGEDVLIKKGDLVGISGPVGSGKSSLLYAILGEIEGGRRHVLINTNAKDGIGYVSQTPWIRQCSVRDNILFRAPYDEDRYTSVIKACALEEDIRLWEHGDYEMIGESGCTLSGGQKARIALARAVYRDVEIYLLDDILSSVDREVARHLFQECVVKLLAGKTRIMVTHLDEQSDSFDWLIQMNEGKIVKQGPGKSFQDKNHLIDATVAHLPIEDSRNCESAESSTDFVSHSYSDSASTNEIEKEVSAMGVVKLTVYYKYWKSVGHGLAVLILLSVIGMQVSRVAVDWWLSLWVSVKTDLKINNTNLYYLTWFEKDLIGNSPSSGFDYKHFLTVYMAIGTLNAVIVIVRSFSFAKGGIRAAIKIHTELLRRISEASMQFFYSSPLGRILNRFSSDTYTVDDELPFDLNILLMQFAALIGVLVTTMYGIPWLCIFIAPLIPVYLWLQNQYRMTSRELKRIVSVARSGLYSHISETMSGLTTIRAFQNSYHFEIDNGMLINSLLQCQLSTIAAQAWLNIRLQLIGVCIIGVVCAITVLQRNFDVVHAGFIGLAITYALTLTGCLEGALSIFVETERKMVALERVDEYIERVEQESYHHSSTVALPFAWPSQGTISFENVFLRYRQDTSYSLKNVTFNVLSGEKIGIVGRTGAGKSSLFSSLFRLTDMYEGQIYLDAVDIRFVPLKKLRSKMTIIPQDPFIFAGTVRDNLDPLRERNEFSIWDVVNKLDLQSFIARLGGIRAQICDESSSLSVGEKQLICLMRAILKNSKIVCIDEATANVDSETDERIRKVIKSAFITSTVLMIAHRIETVLDCHRVLVMGEGEVLEFDSPESLLRNEDSHFYKLVNQEGHC